jgi:hypothetical protein
MGLSAPPSLCCSCAPCQLGFAVGPFQMEATTHPAAATLGASGAAQQKQLTHFAPQQLPPELAVAAVLAAPPTIPAEPTSSDGGGGGDGASRSDSLSRSGHFFTLVFALFEELLGASCPLPAMQQVFLPPELLLLPGGEGQVAAGLQLLSTAHLIQPRAIEQSSECQLPGAAGLGLSALLADSRVQQHLWPGLALSHPAGSPAPAVAARCAIARCVARQWFGVLLRAATPLDEWLVEGECHGRHRQWLQLPDFKYFWWLASVLLPAAAGLLDASPNHACSPAFPYFPLPSSANSQVWPAGWRSSTCGSTWAGMS